MGFLALVGHLESSLAFRKSGRHPRKREVVQPYRSEGLGLSGTVAGGRSHCEGLDHPFGQMRYAISAGDETEQYIVARLEVYHGFRLPTRTNAGGTAREGYYLEYPSQSGFPFLRKRLKGFLEGLLELLLRYSLVEFDELHMVGVLPRVGQLEAGAMVSGREKEKSAAVTATVGMDGSSLLQPASANGAIRLTTIMVHNRYIIFTVPSFLRPKFGMKPHKSLGSSRRAVNGASRLIKSG